MRTLATVVVLVLLAAGCLEEPDGTAPSVSATPQSRTPPNGPFTVRSSAFQPQQAIPREHSCDGGSTSPPLAFTNLPVNTTSIALIMEDPDAPSGTVQHWRFWNLPWNVTQLPAGSGGKLSSYGAKESQPYRGPCPPNGEHRYFFYAFGVDRMLDLASDTNAAGLRAALQGHTTAADSMYGTYFRIGVPLASA
jgi:Raf kinase inhibitor-like YbhB/YbcL family protein